MSALILALSLVVPTASAEEGAVRTQTPGLTWSPDPGSHVRWRVDNTVELPAAVLFKTDFNHEARVLRWRSAMVLDCEASDVSPRRVVWSCAVEDAALEGATFAVDQGRLNDILHELDEKLTDSVVEFEISSHGRLHEVKLRQARLNKQHNRRTNRMNETLRQIVRRGLAGFDLDVPAKPTEGAWVQLRSTLLEMPAPAGTMSVADVASAGHAVGDRYVAIRTSGAGVIQPELYATTEAWYDADIEAIAAFDRELGVLAQREWTVVAKPTASNPAAQGFAGLDYLQSGRIVMLGPDEEARLFATREEALRIAP